MKNLRAQSMLLAAALQVLPIVRVAVPAHVLASPAFAVILKFLARTVAVLGSVHAVSGATTFINSPFTVSGKVGTAITARRLTTTGHSAGAWSSSPKPPCPGITLSTTGILSGTPTQAGTFTANISAWENSNFSGGVTTSTFTFTITGTGTAPTFTTGLTPQTVPKGANVTFNVVTSGTTPITYIWSKDGTVISGATTNTLTLNSVTSASTGTYSVIASNSAGSATNSAALTVHDPPVFSVAPVSQTAAVGSKIILAATVTGTGPFGYQWKKDNAAIPGATLSSYTINSVTTADAGVYSITATNSVGTNTQSAALTVLVPPAFTTNLPPQTVNVGANVSWNVVTTGSSPITYQWRKNGVSINGAINPSFSLTSVTAADAATYSVVASNAAGSATNSTVLTVISLPAAAKVSQPIISAGSLVFTFPGEANHSYAVEARTNLEAGTWTVVTNIATLSQAQTVSFSDALPTTGRKFYRVSAR